jgi:hypothetical protein
VLFTPVWLLWVLWIDWRAFLSRRVLGWGSLIVVAGLAVNLYIPIRANADPPINWAQPRTLAQTLRHIERAEFFEGTEQIRRHGGVRDWVLHSADGLAGVGRAYSWPLVPVLLLGAVVLGRRRRDALWAILAMVGLDTLLLNAVLGEEFDFAWRYAHRVYYLPSHVVVAPCLAAGFAAALGRLRGRAARAVGITCAAVAVAALGAWNAPAVDRSDDTLARDFGLAFLRSLPPGAGLLPLGEEVVSPILYLKYVEGVRTDVEVLSPSFGWDGKPVTSMASAVPITEALRSAIPTLAGYRTVPYGLGYLLVPRHAPAQGYADFVPVADPLPEPGGRRRGEDLFEIEIDSHLSLYHARLGAKRAVDGRRNAALREFDLAESLARDAYACFALARIYGDLEIRPERRRGLLRKALALHDRYADPAIHRYYPVSRHEIVAALAALR